MRHMLTVFIYELRRNGLRKGFLFTTLGLPLIGFLLFFGVQLLSGRANEEAVRDLEEQLNFKDEYTVGYVDLSGLFTGTGSLARSFVRFETEDAAHAALDAGQVDMYYIFTEDYAETGEVYQVIPTLSLNQIDQSPVTQLVFSEFVDEIEPMLALRLRYPSNIQRIEFSRITVTEPAEGATPTDDGVTRDEGRDFILVYGFAIIFMFALFGTNGYLMQSVIEEKETRLIEILVSSVRPIELLAGKILALGVLGIIQIVIWIISIFALTQIASSIAQLPSALSFLNSIDITPGMFLLLLAYFVLGYLFYAAVFGGIGAISASMSEGPNLAAIFTVPLWLPFLFLTMFINTPNATLPVVLSIIPFTSPLSMVMRMSITTVPFFQVALSLLLLAVTDVFMIWAAGRLFRVQSLLAGQVPRLRDLPALIRG